MLNDVRMKIATLCVAKWWLYLVFNALITENYRNFIPTKIISLYGSQQSVLSLPTLLPKKYLLVVVVVVVIVVVLDGSITG